MCTRGNVCVLGVKYMCIRGIDLASVSTFVDCIIKLFLQCGMFSFSIDYILLQ